MVSALFFCQLVLVALVWLYVLRQWAWPSDPAPGYPMIPEPSGPRPQRQHAPKPFAGLTTKPHCDACAHASAPYPRALSAPPPRIIMARGRHRQVDTSHHFCPNPDCAYQGWVGWGNLRANGLPTICQPQFVNFLPHLHDWLTTNAACIIAGAMTQHGHKNTQQSVANIA
jgi:hypothetical protein